jgi:ADP-dependent NAD(P)H-hydrate dehydratase
MQSPTPDVEVVTRLPVLPARDPEGHKGSYGRVLVVAGSRGMTGAAVLCASGALRGGAGLVFVAVPETVVPVVAAANPCYLTVPLPDDGSGRHAWEAIPSVLEEAGKADVVVCGPGLGKGDVIAGLIEEVVAHVTRPLVLDADGLNALGHPPSLLSEREAPTVLTPHPGEFARLLGTDTATVQQDRAGRAVPFAEAFRVVLVLKGHGTLVTDGRRLSRNPTGNAGMATGGTGDVLAGLIGALIGQGLEPFAAARLGVWLHGRAGDLARDDLGEVSLIASDLLDYLPRAFRDSGPANKTDLDRSFPDPER